MWSRGKRTGKKSGTRGDEGGGGEGKVAWAGGLKDDWEKASYRFVVGFSYPFFLSFFCFVIRLPTVNTRSSRYTLHSIVKENISSSCPQISQAFDIEKNSGSWSIQPSRFLSLFSHPPDPLSLLSRFRLDISPPRHVWTNLTLSKRRSPRRFSPLSTKGPLPFPYLFLLSLLLLLSVNRYEFDSYFNPRGTSRRSFVTLLYSSRNLLLWWFLILNSSSSSFPPSSWTTSRKFSHYNGSFTWKGSS